MKVVVCVCTYRRPEGLRNLLEHLALIECEHELVIAVADNDNEKREGIEVVKKMPADYPWKLVSEAVAEQGISYSRNTAAKLALAQTPHIVGFLDDDEWPSKQWLSEMLRVQSATDADAVGGPTLPVFPEHASDAQRHNAYFGADLHLPDTSPCQLEAAGNFIIKASVLQSMSPDIFNPEFALSGGEDLAFFMQLKRAGASMFWAANASVSETVPEDRLSADWMKQRIMIIANSRVHVMRSVEPGLLASLTRGAKTVALLTQASLISIVGLFNHDYASRAESLRWKFWGKFTAHLNQRPMRTEGR